MAAPKESGPEEARRALEVFLSAEFDRPAFDIEDAREAGEIRAHLEMRSKPIGPCDTLIAAQARRRGAVLVTLNTRAFERVPKTQDRGLGGVGVGSDEQPQPAQTDRARKAARPRAVIGFAKT